MGETYGLDKLGLHNIGKVFRNLPVERLIEHELANGEVVIGQNGATMVTTGKFTGRSPKDKFFVDEPGSSENMWWGPVNSKITAENFDALYDKVKEALSDEDLYMFDGYCGADKENELPVRIITKKAWHAHFVNNMFIVPEKEDLEGFEPGFTILNASGSGYFEKEFEKYGLNSEVFVIFNLAKKFAIIAGTEYGGEMKKGIFSVMNYLLPLKGIMPMHCSANIGKDGDVALFFGLSGTGKTTLSTDPERPLIGDDEHGWSDNGVFNFEGGCYAKTIDLDKNTEPDIWNAIRHGAILENVVYDEETRVVDYSDKSITENTRVSYPLDHIENSVSPSIGGQPKNIIFLTADAFGVIPPVSRLTPEQASYQFLNGYTAKVAGTERGVTEPQATFSTCFGGPFMTLRPKVYGELLAKRMKEQNVNAYLVNTGWTGGPYGVGKRMNLPDTRAMITAILNGSIENSEFVTDEVFGYEFPTTLEGVDSKVLNPRNTWPNVEDYDKKRIELAKMFQENFKIYAADAPELEAAGPKI
ncbi:MAG: phosphoenolpyruvate carboxykinase (ATP) [bacterium]|jgi:phosphoenolpyruvate carboxykinase (ATP)